MDDGSSEIEQARDVELNTDTRQLFAHLSMAINLKRIADQNETDTRDYFAGMALQGLLASGSDRHGALIEQPAVEELVGQACDYADAMMRARKQ